MARTYETAIKIVGAITKAFTGDTKNAAQALGKLQTQLKGLKAAEKAAQSYKKLDDALTKSKAKYDQAVAALKRLEDAERKAGGATKESTAWRKAGQRAVAQAARELDRASKAAGKNSEALAKMGVDTSHLVSEQERLTRALANTERQERALGRYEAARERLFGKRKESTPLFQKAGEQVRGIARDVAVLGTALGAASAGLVGMVIKIGNAGDETAKMAKRINIGVEALQELRYAGEREGASAEEVDNALGKLAINLGKWKNKKAGGSGDSSLAIPGLTENIKPSEGGAGGDLNPFKMLGLDAKKLADLKPEEQMLKIADAMGKLKTSADRAAVSQAIFGREGGLKLLPLLKLGSKEINQERQEARDLGYVLSKEAAASAEEFNDRMLDAKLAATGMANTLAVALLPTVTDTFVKFTKWVKENRAAIQAWTRDAATWITSKALPALVKIANGVKELAEKGGALISKLASLAGGFDNLVLAVGALRLAPLASTLTKIAIEGVKAAAAMLQFASANSAAAAASGEGGGAAGAVGLLGKAKAIGGAAAVGVGVGAFLGREIETRGLENFLPGVGFAEAITGNKLGARGDEDRLAQAQAGVASATRARDAARAKRLQGTAFGDLVLAPVINFNDTPTKAAVSKGFDQAKRKTLDALDAAERKKRRVSFGE